MKNTPYKVGITGHRDLKEECIEHYEKKVSELLQELQKKHKELVVYSPLADGADRLVVKEAQKLNIPYIAILPMPKNHYIIDFDANSKKEFDSMLNRASEVVTLPLCKDSTLEDISTYNKQRDTQYEAVGHKVADLSDTLIALWDGKHIGLRAGTGEIVEYFKNKKSGVLSHLLVARNNDSQVIMVEFNDFAMEDENE